MIEKLLLNDKSCRRCQISATFKRSEKAAERQQWRLSSKSLIIQTCLCGREIFCTVCTRVRLSPRFSGDDVISYICICLEEHYITDAPGCQRGGDAGVTLEASLEPRISPLHHCAMQQFYVSVRLMCEGETHCFERPASKCFTDHLRRRQSAASATTAGFFWEVTSRSRATEIRTLPFSVLPSL